jgi:hypothetical protein
MGLCLWSRSTILSMTLVPKITPVKLTDMWLFARILLPPQIRLRKYCSRPDSVGSVKNAELCQEDLCKEPIDLQAYKARVAMPPDELLSVLFYHLKVERP